MDLIDANQGWSRTSGLTRCDLSDAAHPFGTLQEIDVGCATVLANWMSYAGEAGSELFVPVEFTLGVHKALTGAGAV